MAKSKVAQRLGLNIGLEDIDEDEVVMDYDSEETVESELLEVAEAQEEVEVEEEAIEELEEAADGLDEIAEEVEASMENGGLDPQAARFMQLSVESYTHRLGVQAPVVASMESFGGTSGKMNSTQVSLEGIKEFVASIWEKIKSMLASLRAKLKNLYIKLFDSAPRLAKRAEAIRTKAENTKGTAEEKTISGPLAALHVNGKAPKVKDAAKTLLDSMKFNKETSKDLVKSTEGLADALSDVASKPEAVAEADADLAKKVKTTYKDLKGGDKRFGDGVSSQVGEVLPGGKQAYISIPEGESGGKMLAGMQAGMISVDKKKEVDASGDFATMSTADVISACDDIAKMATGIADYKKEWEGREKAVEKLTKAGDALSKSTKGDDITTDQKTLLNTLVRAAGQQGRIALGGDSSVIAYALKTGNACLKVCEKSLSQYKEA